MRGMIELLFDWLVSLLKSQQRLQVENLVLRHQINILRRQSPRCTRLSNPDRLVFVWLYRLCPTVVDAVAIIRPETLIRWHRSVRRQHSWDRTGDLRKGGVLAHRS